MLGGASPDLLRQTSETLAGRVAFHELDGFSLREVDDLERLWLRGGFPLSWLARSMPASRRWRDGFIRTFLARDVLELGSLIPSTTLRRFWTMLAHWHGQLWNGAELGRAFGVSHTTVRRYLDLLTSVFVVRQLHPWYENVGKRQVRSPKVYIGDSGILHALLGLTTREEVVSHPKVGASWEGFVVQQIIHLLSARQAELPDQPVSFVSRQRILGVPLGDLLVAVELNFQDDARLEDDLVAPVFEDDDIAALETQPFAQRRRQRNLPAPGHYQWLTHLTVHASRDHAAKVSRLPHC